MYPRRVTTPPAPSTSDLQTRLRRSKILNVVLAALSVFLFVVAVAEVQQAPSATPEDTSTPTTSPEAGPSEPEAQETSLGLELRDPQDPMAIGDVDAPVVMVHWTDMRCPYCALFSRDTLPTIIEEYVDTGDVRIEYRDVAFFGEESELASVAARAAANQDKYSEYMFAVYAAAPESGHADLPREALIGFAEQVGVPDIGRFTADLDDPKLAAAVQQSTIAAQQIGVNSVPFFVVGNQAVSGAQPIDTFRSFLDTALAATE